MHEFKLYLFNGRERIYLGMETVRSLAEKAAAALAMELQEHGYNAWHFMTNDGTGSYVVNCFDEDDRRQHHWQRRGKGHAGGTR